MTVDALAIFVERTRATFGPLAPHVVAAVHAELERLVRAPATEPWLASIRREAPASKELHRDPDHGFVLLVHSEPEGLYRPPHDHGRGWVVYALASGEMEITTYARVEESDGRVRLVERESSVLRAGDARVYWPGDVHDTRCVRGPSLLFRFTDRDLKDEDQRAHRVARYVERDGVFVAGPA